MFDNDTYTEHVINMCNRRFQTTSAVCHSLFTRGKLRGCSKPGDLKRMTNLGKDRWRDYIVWRATHGYGCNTFSSLYLKRWKAIVTAPQVEPTAVIIDNRGSLLFFELELEQTPDTCKDIYLCRLKHFRQCFYELQGTSSSQSVDHEPPGGRKRKNVNSVNSETVSFWQLVGFSCPDRKQ